MAEIAGGEAVPSVAALFEQVAARQPDAPAIESAHGSYTYAELNRAANRIARAIVASHGSDPEPVLLLFGKSALVAAAILGVLKAGKFFVPLDAGDPLPRLRLVAQDAGARLVLTDSAHEAQARELVDGASALNVQAATLHADESNPGLPSSPAQTAYLVYTSGSTSVPKGIQHSQHTLAKTALVRGQLGYSTASDRTALLYSLSVVQSTQFLFAALLNGGTACVYDLQQQGLLGLAAWMRQERITAFIATPTVFRHFAATLDGRADMPHLRLISLAGEPVLSHDLELYQRCMEAPCRLRMSYGSTEAPVSAEWVADHHTRLAQAIAPGGYAWGGSSLFIRDEQGRVLPPGEIGEIVVQSDMLALGYWQRPDLTARKFLPDPAGGARRLYRTGDLGRLSPAGMLELCGRVDDQLKIHGNRIEPAEVESALYALDGVRQAVVLPQALPNGGMRLIAYLAGDGPFPDAPALRARLAERLPAHMIPAAFVSMPALPLLAGSKVDRAALLAAAPVASQAGDMSDRAESAVPASVASAAGIGSLPTDYLSVVAQFEQMAARQPDAPAIESANGSYTYDELNRAANRIARAITVAYGNESEPVLLLFGKSASVAAAMLGVLKAGKFYAPLDATDAPDRLRRIAQDAGARLVLTDSAHEADARVLAGGGAALNVEALDPATSDANLGLALAPSRPGALLYTSGSTGAPKGILHSQYSMVKFAVARQALGISPGGRASLLYALSVLSSMTILFGALLNGGSVCLYDLQAQGLAGLVDWLRRQHIALYQSTPTVFRNFVAALGDNAGFPDLRMVVLTGEPVLARDVALFQRNFPSPCHLRVGYGATETRTASDWFADQQTQLDGLSVPGGRAWGDTRISIRDEQGRVLPPGEAGEIVVQSDILALGYWQRPDLTARKFLPDPDGGAMRLFRTGDLGRLLPDGMLELLGRADDQLKIRGNRVEPAEVEAALFALDGVQHAAVVPQAAANGEPRLIAYLVYAGDMPDADTLRARLAGRLPVHMLPAVFVRLPAMPVNDAGKVDRRALPPPGLPAAAPDPADDDARRMLAIWREVFGHALGPDDHFVELGGHSLTAARITARASAEFGVPVDVTVLAQAPTAAQLARRMRAPKAAGAVLVPLRAGGRRAAFFCVHGFVGGVLDYGPLARHLGADQPVYALQSPAFDGRTPPHDDLTVMAADYVRVLREFQPRGPYHIGGYCFGGVVAFEMARQLRAQGEPAGVVAVIEGYTSRTAMAPRRWTNPRHAAAFVLNLPFWARDVMRPGARAALARVARRMRTGRSPRVIDEVRLGGAVSDTLYHIMQVHVDALRRYRPGCYDGTVTLLRVRGQSLWRAHDPAMGWRDVSAAVRIRTIAGEHDSVLAEPDVQSLAAALAAELDRAATI